MGQRELKKLRSDVPSAAEPALATVTSSVKNEGPVPRRKRKKDKTRRLIQTSAMNLFLEKGFDNVTIAEISEKADVDPTTFWRHFRSKEATLFAEQNDWSQEFHTAFEASDRSESLLHRAMTALFAASSSVDSEFDLQRSMLIARDRSPSIEAAIRGYENYVRTELTKAIANDLGVDPATDPRPTGAAATIAAAASWLRETVTDPGTGTLAPVHFISLEEAVKSIAELLR